jgi:hypothetical protein
MSIKASLSPSIEPPIFQGDLLETLFRTVEKSEGASPSPSRGSGVTIKPEPRDYFRLSVLPPESIIHCSNVDCQRKARVLIDARDEDVLPFCSPCAYVSHAMWMAGV